MAVSESGLEHDDNSSDEGGTAWIVSFKESSRIAKDEIVAEKAFTRVVKQANPDDDSWRKLLEDSSEELEDVVAGGLDKEVDPSAAAASTTMRRSRRQSNSRTLSTKGTAARRSKSDTTTTASPVASEDNAAEADGKAVPKARYGTRFARGNSPRNLKRKAANELIAQQKKKKQHREVQTKGRKGKKKSSSSPISKQNETVVEVKMNTGTLYLYRGLHPRAVFVRKY
jgi:hypothetical protein